MRKLRPFLFLSAIVVSLAGCSDDSTDAGTDTGTGTDTSDSDTGGADTSGTDTSTDAPDAELFPDTTFRLTGVTIIRPAGVGPILENLINSDIEDGKLHVLIQMGQFQGEWPTTFTITGNAGKEVDGGYTWYDGVEIDHAEASIDADGLFSGNETLSIIFPALEPNATEPIQIPVSDLQLEGALFEDEGMWVVDGTLSGAILAAEIEGLTVDLGEPRLLSDLLGGEESMDYPPGAEGEARTGWRLEAEISADPVTFVAPAE